MQDTKYLIQGLVDIFLNLLLQIWKEEEDGDSLIEWCLSTYLMQIVKGQKNWEDWIEKGVTSHNRTLLS